MLLQAGVNAEQTDDEGLTPLHLSCLGGEKGHTDAVWAFLDAGVAPDEPSADGKMPLQMAAGANENSRHLLQEAVAEKMRGRGAERYTRG